MVYILTQRVVRVSAYTFRPCTPPLSLCSMHVSMVNTQTPRYASCVMHRLAISWLPPSGLQSRKAYNMSTDIWFQTSIEAVLHSPLLFPLHSRSLTCNTGFSAFFQNPAADYLTLRLLPRQLSLKLCGLLRYQAVESYLWRQLVPCKTLSRNVAVRKHLHHHLFQTLISSKKPPRPATQTASSEIEHSNPVKKIHDASYPADID